MSTLDVVQIGRDAEQHSEPIRALLDRIEEVVVGQRPMIEGLVVGLLTGGHVLLEGAPGLAKTLAVTTLARAIDASFARVQFTPDLLPADLIGTLVYNPTTGEFTPRTGPIFANLVLADEINRAPAKVQSALLESMQERRVTIGDATHDLPDPFLVLATQNPIEQEGTHPLPEAQVDRFMLKLRIDYPSRDQERTIVDRMAGARRADDVEPVIHLDDVQRARETIDRVYLDDRVRDFLVDVVRATREPQGFGLDIGGLIEFGASPRAAIHLARAGRARAFLHGRGYVTPDDVKNVAMDVLRHRVILTYEAEAEDLDAERIVGRILDHIPAP